MLAARKAFPESGALSLSDFWVSADQHHEFAVFFAGREIKGGFESMYWSYLVFVKPKGARDWTHAQVFELTDNHPAPFAHTLEWLEKNSRQLSPGIQQ